MDKKRTNNEQTTHNTRNFNHCRQSPSQPYQGEGLNLPAAARSLSDDVTYNSN